MTLKHNKNVIKISQLLPEESGIQVKILKRLVKSIYS